MSKVKTKAKTEPKKVPIICAGTNLTVDTEPKADNSPSLPRGWKMIGGKPYSPAGVENAFFPRTISIPVASSGLGYEPVWGPDNCKKSNTELRRLLKVTFQQAIEIQNRIIQTLVCSDNAPIEWKRPKNAKDDTRLYPTLPKIEVDRTTLGRQAAALVRGGLGIRLSDGTELPREAEIDSQSLYALVGRAISRWKEARYDLRIRRTVSVPSERQPWCPVPFSSIQDIVRDPANGWFYLKLRIAGQRFTLRLSGSPDFRRQQASLKEALEQGAVGEIHILEKRVSDRDRMGGTTRFQKGANKVPTRIMIEVCLLLPKKTITREDRVMEVSTCSDRFWQAKIDSDEWNFNEPQIRRWAAELVKKGTLDSVAGTVDAIGASQTAHADRLHQMSEDQKFERRLPKAERSDINGARSEMCRRHDNKVTDFYRKIVRMLVELAKRQKVCSIVYNDTVKDFCSSFPWFKLRSLLKQQLAEFGILFEHREDEPEDESKEVIAE